MVVDKFLAVLAFIWDVFGFNSNDSTQVNSTQVNSTQANNHHTNKLNTVKILSNPQRPKRAKVKGGLFSLPLTILLAAMASMLTFSASAQVEEQWQDVSGQLSIAMSNPIRSRRSPDATVILTITNNGTETLSSPARLVLHNLLPSGSISFDGLLTTDTGEPMLALAEYIGGGVAPGGNLAPISLKILGGGRVSFGFDTTVEQPVVEPPQGLSVNITSPASLITVGVSPLAIQGTISANDAVLTVNGQVVSPNAGQYSASVALNEGNNTIVARAVRGAEQTTDSIIVSLDTTPPYITLESHVNGQTVYTNSVTVTGLINDIVRGTVESAQANVSVNGVAANVSNRSYAATGIPLSVGSNVINIQGTDQVGNIGRFTFTLNYVVPQGNRIELVSGQDQSGLINSQLPAPLMVRVINGASQPMPNTPVVLRVMQGSGAVGLGTGAQGRAVVVNTDANGMASTSFLLGARVGTANQKVRARVVGIASEVIFNASATGLPGNKLSINSGNNQRGVVGQSLPAPLVTVVTDEGANVVAGARVRYVATVGNGHFGGQQVSKEVLTDSDGRAVVTFVLGDLGGIDAQRITASLVDAPVGQLITAGFTATGFVSGDAGQTTISGVVLDNQDTPIPGVTLRVDDGSNRQAISDAQGQFVITEAPIGPVHIIADGSTASVEGEYPALSYNLVTISGVDNPLLSPIYMVKLNLDNSVFVGPADAVLTLDEYPGFKLEVAANSVTFPDGSTQGNVSVTPVNAATVPMAPPNGMQPQFIVTVQPTGTLFDPPARLSLPNFDGHAPGAQVEMYSFDHDLEEFVAIGLGSVSEDGSVVSSNPGVGVVKAGWHCGSQPGGQGCTHDCPVCKDCDGDCNCIIADNDPRAQEQNVEGDCKSPECNGGAVVQVNDDSDIPLDEDCKTCNAGQVEEAPDGSNPSDSQSCCFEGAKLDKYGQTVGNIFDGPLENMCPQRTQHTSRLHEVDGCSAPAGDKDNPMNNLPYPFGLLNIASTAFGQPIGVIGNPGLAGPLACNQHDICYQSCAAPGTDLSASRSACDSGMKSRMDNTCAAAYPATCPSNLSLLQCGSYHLQRSDCSVYSSTYYNVLRAAGFFAAYKERQEQYCQCCS